MAEQRLIDANNLGAGKANPDAFERKEYAYGWNNALQAVTYGAPTINPESLPVVRKLRKELARVTAERDEAVSDLENIMAYNSDTCQSRKNNQCYVRGGTKPCLPKWRGPQKEE